MSLPTTIYPRGTAWYTYWYDARTRRKVWRKLGPNRALAGEALKVLQRELVAGPTPTQRDYAPLTFARYYQEHYKPDYLGAGTLWQAKQTHMIEHIIMPRWGSHPLHTITTYDAEAWYRQLLGTYSRKYASHLLVTWRTMLQRAAGKFIAACPVGRIRRAPAERHIPDTLTRDEVADLADRLDGRSRALVLTWVQVGLRPAEMVWLQWSDVDLDAGKLFVRAKDGHRIKDAEDRCIDLTASAKAILTAYRGQTKAGQRDHVFGTAEGHPKTTLPEEVRTVLKRAGIRRGNALLLRHTFASMFLSSGGSLAELKRYMGHSSITTTEQHYATFLPGRQSTIHAVDFGLTLAPAGNIVGQVAS